MKHPFNVTFGFNLHSPAVFQSLEKLLKRCLKTSVRGCRMFRQRVDFSSPKSSGFLLSSRVVDLSCLESRRQGMERQRRRGGGGAGTMKRCHVKMLQ